MSSDGEHFDHVVGRLIKLYDGCKGSTGAADNVQAMEIQIRSCLDELVRAQDEQSMNETFEEIAEQKHDFERKREVAKRRAALTLKDQEKQTKAAEAKIAALERDLEQSETFKQEQERFVRLQSDAEERMARREADMRARERQLEANARADYSEYQKVPEERLANTISEAGARLRESEASNAAKFSKQQREFDEQLRDLEAKSKQDLQEERYTFDTVKVELETDLAAVNLSLKEAQTSEARYKQELDALERRLEERKIAQGVLEEELRNAERLIAEKNSERQSLQRELEDARRLSSERSNQTDIFNQRLAEKDKVIEDKIALIADFQTYAKSSKESHEHELEEKNAKIADLQCRLERCEIPIQDLRDQLSESSLRNRHLKDQLKEADDALHAKMKEVDKANELARQGAEVVENLKQELLTCKESHAHDLGERNGKIAELQCLLERSESQIQDLRDQSSESSVRSQHLKEQLKEADESLHAKMKEVDEANEVARQGAEAVEKLKQELLTCKAAKRESEEETAWSQERMSKLEQEMENLRREVLTCKAANGELKEEAARSAAHVSLLEESLTEKETAHSKAAEATAKKIREYENAHRELQELYRGSQEDIRLLEQQIEEGKENAHRNSIGLDHRRDSVDDERKCRLTSRKVIR